jgi:hypothetical protein
VNPVAQQLLQKFALRLTHCLHVRVGRGFRRRRFRRSRLIKTHTRRSFLVQEGRASRLLPNPALLHFTAQSIFLPEILRSIPRIILPVPNQQRAVTKVKVRCPAPLGGISETLSFFLCNRTPITYSQSCTRLGRIIRLPTRMLPRRNTTFSDLFAGSMIFPALCFVGDCLGPSSRRVFFAKKNRR